MVVLVTGGAGFIGSFVVDRLRDHICYISDLRRLKADYPGWELTRSLEDILRELAAPPAG